MNKARKTLTALGLSAGLAAGGLSGLALGAGSTLAGAQSDTTTTVAASTSSSASSSTAAPADNQRPDPSVRLQETLKPLVTDGTITQAQADKVVEALKAAGPMGGDHGPGGPRGGGPGAEATAKALGITADELRTELQSGKTIADVAKAKGVDIKTVISAMVTAEKEHLAADVKAGKITQAQADEHAANAEAHATAMANGERPQGGTQGQPPAAPAAPTTTAAGN